MDKNLKAAYLKIGRELCEDVNKYPQAFRETLELIDGKLRIKGDTGEAPAVAVENMTKAELIKSVCSPDFQFKKL